MDNFFLILFLISLLCLPVALILPQLFRFLFRNHATRKTTGLFFGGCMLVFFVLFGITTDAAKNTTKQQSGNASTTAKQTTAIKIATPTPKPVTPTPKPVKKMNIVITSMIVKKVAPTTYRYFFNVANNDTNDFTGDVWIELFNGHDEPQPLIFGGATQSYGNNSIQAGANSVTYVDDSHGPSQIDGIDGANTFRYTVSINGNDVAGGKDDISGQYENDLQQ